MTQPAPSSTPLNFSNQVTLNASGNGQCSLGPQGRNVWRIRVATVLTSTAVKTPQCLVYMGPQATPPYLIDGTTTGNLNATGFVAEYPLRAGEQIFAVWTGGDAGAAATLSIFGDEWTQPT